MKWVQGDSQNNTGTDPSDWMSDIAAGSVLEPPSVPAAASWESSGALGGMVVGEESPWERVVIYLQPQVFHCLTTSMAVQMCINGIVTLNKCPGAELR